MEPTVLPNLAKNTIMALFTAKTPLKPHPPLFQPEPFSAYVEELDYDPSQLAILPPSIEGTWQDCLYYGQMPPTKELGSYSLVRHFLISIEDPLLNLGKAMLSHLEQMYWNSTDVIDRTNLEQWGRWFSWGKKTIGDFCAKHLVEGKFLGYCNPGYYDKAVVFAFHRMMFHCARFHAMRELSIQGKEQFFIIPKLPQILEIEKEQFKKYNLWRYRWIEAENIVALNYVLTNQSLQYQQIKESLADKLLIQNSDPTPASKSPDKQRIYDYNYKIESMSVRLTLLLTELNASYFNHMLEIKPKRWFEPKGESYLNEAFKKVNGLFYTLEQPRHFKDLRSEVVKTTLEAYDQLFPLYRTKRRFEEVKKEYENALENDNFIAAKWISLAYNTEEDAPNFKWLQEAESFENYKRLIDRLLNTQDQIDDLITEMTNFTRFLFKQSDKQKDKEPILQHYRHGLEIIIYLWEKRDEIDTLRLLLRTGFKRQFEKRINECNFTLLQRPVRSVINKGKRAAILGDPINNDPYFNDIHPKVTNEFFRDFCNLLRTIKRFKETALGTAAESLELKLEAMSKKYLPDDLLRPLPHLQKDYKIFYTYELFANYVSSYKISDGNSLLFLNTLLYNMEHNCTLFPKIPYWNAQREEVQKLFTCYLGLTKLKEAIATLEMYFPPENVISKMTLPGLKEKLSKYNLQGMNVLFQKYIKSDFNTRTPLNIDLVSAKRLLKSFYNKLNRLNTTGSLFDQTPEFPSVYPAIMNVLSDSALKINKIVNKVLEEHPILTLDLLRENIGDVVLTYLPESALKPWIKKEQLQLPQINLVILEDYFQTQPLQHLTETSESDEFSNDESEDSHQNDGDK